MNESEIPRFRDAGLNPVGSVRGRFADRKQSGLLSKILKAHMSKKAAPRRAPKAKTRGKTIEADKNVHFRYGQTGVFY